VQYVTSDSALASLSTDRIYFIDEDDAWCIFSGLAEKI
jgi:hypothetical protein